MKSGDWAERIQHMQQWVEHLQQRDGQPLTLSGAPEEIATTLEELSVAHEELRQQNEELLESRRALEAEQQRYQELFEFAPDGYLVTDAEGVIQEANHRGTVLLNIPPFRLLGKPLAVYVPTPERKEFRARLNRLLAGETIGEWEMRLQRVGGEPFPVAVTVAATRDPQGNVVALRWLVRDITARKQTEEALVQSQAHFQRLVQSHFMGMVVSAEDRMLVTNDTFAQLVGYTREELCNGVLNWHDLTPLEYWPFDERALDELRTWGECTPFEKVYRCKDDRLVPVLLGAVRLSQEPLQWVSLVLDITDRKKAEEALRESEERYRRLAQEREQQLVASDRRISFGELAASLAHEFNNPLGIVLGFTQDLLKDVAPDHPLRSRLQIIESETQRCKRLMERLRDFARPAPIQLRWIDLAATIRTSLELVTSECRKRRVSLSPNLSSDLPQIEADQQQLQQVLLNLFFNALEAMPHGGTLTVQATLLPRSAKANGKLDSEEVAIMVTDTGTGIAADHLGQIFRPFFTTKTKEGMGLGLSICESIMTAHGGRITVDSRIGQGATFSLFFPATVI